LNDAEMAIMIAPNSWN